MAPVLRIFLLSLLLPLCYSDQIAQYCAKSFTSSAIQTNINHVISDLVKKTSVQGFAITSSGKGSDKIYGLAQCRGDVNSDDCALCLADAKQQLPGACPNQADGRIWYDYCFMRYDNVNFVGQSDTGFATILYNVQNISDPDGFDNAVNKLVNKVFSDTVSPNSGSLGREKTKFDKNTTIYALAECTKDLQPSQCSQCLSSTLQYFPIYCTLRQGCRVLYTSCMVRYEIYPFFFPVDGYAGNSEAAKYIKAIIHPH